MGKEGISGTDLVSVLDDYAERHGDDVLYRFLLTGEGTPETVSALDLWQRAARIAAFLDDRGCRGQRVLFLTPSGIDFIAGLFGCLAAGAVVVPAPPPHRERGMARIRSIITDCQPHLILSTQPQQTTADGGPDPAVAAIPWHVIADVLAAVPTAERPHHRLTGDMPAILQYTSGSTGDPKGVIITHANALANIHQQHRRTRDPLQPELVSWLPVHHDMGLFGKILAAPVLGGRLTFMPPGVFIQNPLRWLRAISDYGAVRSGAPNFAYDLCVKAYDGAALNGLRLETWHTAFNGAEPVRAETLAAFAKVYAPYGFRAESWFPTYGLAEATLIVTGPERESPPLVRAYSRADLENDVARAVTLTGEGAGADAARLLVGCGPVIDDHSLRILSPTTGAPLPERQVGEICFAGPSVSPGFFGRPQDTAERFGAGVSDAPGQSFMRTRDLGFLDEGTLFIVSRLDDLIILRGRNVAPQDIEGAILSLSHVHGATAFTEGLHEGEPAVTAVVEVARDLRLAEQLSAMAEAIRDAVWRGAEIALSRLVLVRPGTLPKTTSGKVRRRETRRLLQEELLKTAFIDTATGSAGAAIAESRPIDPEDTAAQVGDQIRRLLDLPQPPGPHEPLYRLGLDSLRAAELAQWLLSTYAAAPSLPDLLSGATLADCQAIVTTAGRPRAASPSILATVATDTTAAVIEERPLTRNQLAMWAEQAAHPGSWFNNVSFAVRLPVAIAPAAVHGAVQELARAHTHLHCRFPAPDGTPRRIADTAAPLPWRERIIDGDRAAFAAALTEEAHRPFALDVAPAWRATLLRQDTLAVVLLTFHHIVCDGWSAARLAEDLSHRLGGEAHTDRTAPDKAGIDAVVGDEEAYLCSAEAEDDRRFWRETLASPPEPPFQRRTEDSVPSRRGQRGISLSGDRLKRLRATAVAERKSVPAVLLALYALTVQQATRRSDLMIGIAASTRSLQQHGALLAPLVNPILVRVRSSAEPGQRSLRAAVTQTSDALQAAFAHRRLPFSLLEAPPAYCAFGHMRLSHGIIAPDTDWMAEPAPSRPIGLMLEAQAMRAPVALSWFESDEACWGDLSFDTAVLPEIFADFWPERFLALLDALTSDAATLVSDHLSAGEQVILAAWAPGPRAAAAPLHQRMPLDALIAVQAARTPDLPAIIDKDGKVRRYSDLIASAAAIASHLRQAGIVPGDVVALCLPRSPEWVAAALGIWQVGGTFVPIDVGAPRERQIFQITDSQAKRVIAEAGRTVVGLANPIPVSDITVALAVPPTPFSPPSADETRAAYILYTSGSTGQPKGVMVPHAALRERLLWKIEAFDLTPEDRVLQSIPPTFDPALWEVFTPLLCGAAVVLAPADTHREPSLLARVVHDHGISAMSCVAGMMPMIADAFETLPPPRLRHIITGGERQTAVSRQRLQAASGATIDHCYGPTEATIFCTHAAYPPLPEAEASAEINALAIDPIGRPVAGAILRIVDEAGLDVPLGTAGELVIGGYGLAIGYVQRPEETRARFIEIGGERFYRSGDSGRWRADGQIEVFGRLDEQMKIRGVRIEPAEIEAALCATGLAAEAAVSVIKHATGDRLAAWVTVAPGLDPTAPPLSGRLVLERAARLLPPGLMPSVVTVVATLPRLPNSKIDRRTLATWVPDPVTAEIIEPAANETEELLLRLWRDLLGNSTLGPIDDVFAYGAHSLMIMHLSARVRAETRKLLPVITVFEQRTIRAQARWLRGEDDSVAATEHPRLSQNSASKTPDAPLVVCIAAGYGDQRRLLSLASALGNACSFWQMLPPGHSAQQEWTLDSLCAAYADLYVQQIGNRPCVLAGFSAAGCIAVELSGVLAHRGITVEKLVLIDSAYPFLPGIALRLFETARDIVRLLDRKQWLGTTPTAHHLRQIVLDEGLNVHLRVVAERPPVFFDGDLSIICGSATDRASRILFLPWRKHARTLRTFKCYGWHGGMFNADRIAGLATSFAEALLRS